MCGKVVPNIMAVRRSMSNNPNGAACFEDSGSQGCIFYQQWRAERFRDMMHVNLMKKLK